MYGQVAFKKILWVLIAYSHVMVAIMLEVQLCLLWQSSFHKVLMYVLYFYFW